MSTIQTDDILYLFKILG